MTITLLPFREPRTTPRVANLAARESNRVAAWREKMRSMAIQDRPPTLIERVTDWYGEVSSEPMFWRFMVALVAASVLAAAWIAA